MAACRVLPISRRTALLGALAGASPLFRPSYANALARPSYGGRLQLSMPVGITRIDPHDPHDLLAALIGPSLFEPLFAQTQRGVVYPTLAAALPQSRPPWITIELRPGLRSARGRPLDASAIAGSLERASRTYQPLTQLNRLRARGKTRLECRTHLSPEQIARLLSAPETALVPPSFNPEAPDTTGALFPSGGTISQLARNPWAPRGGSYVDEVRCQKRNLHDCLRDFETGRSHIGFLGAGLHEFRKGGTRFSLESLGWLVLLPGTDLKSFAAPGVLTEQLSRLPPQGFRSLGVAPLLQNRAGTWPGPPLQILVDRDQPWLAAIAAEIARVWSARQRQITVSPRGRDELARKQASGNFDAILTFVAAGRTTEQKLHELDGTLAPRSALRHSLLGTARRLHLGVLGSLEPHGVVAAGVRNLPDHRSFDLAETELTRS